MREIHIFCKIPFRGYWSTCRRMGKKYKKENLEVEMVSIESKASEGLRINQRSSKCSNDTFMTMKAGGSYYVKKKMLLTKSSTKWGVLYRYFANIMTTETSSATRSANKGQSNKGDTTSNRIFVCTNRTILCTVCMGKNHDAVWIWGGDDVYRPSLKTDRCTHQHRKL